MTEFKCWDNLAEWYVGQRPDSYGVKQTEENITKMLGNIKGKKILDVGIASGYFAAKAQSMGAEVTGIDVSPKMISLARKQPYVSKDINLSLQSVYNLAFKDSSFDVVLADMLLNNTKNIKRVFEQFRGVLKDDGYVVMSLLHEEDTKKKLVCPEKVGEISEAKGKWKNKDTDEEYPYELYHIPMKKLKEAIEETGFVIEEENIPSPPETLKIENTQLYEERLRSPTFLLLKVKKK
jgi:ubiquinone/menaquinone biosynthesis C-methylase UbiE